MKKIVLIITILILFSIASLIAQATFFVSSRELFKQNVINPIPKSISDLKHKKDRSAIQGALVFSFHAKPEDVNLISAKNELREYKEIPEVIQRIVDILSQDREWELLKHSAGMKIFGKIIEGQYEWHAMFLFVSEENVYCIVL